MRWLSTIIFVTVLVLANAAFAADLQGRITRQGSGEAIAYALVVAVLNGTEVARAATTDDGYYLLRVSAGTYTIRITYQNTTTEFSNIVVDSSGRTFNAQIP